MVVSIFDEEVVEEGSVEVVLELLVESVVGVTTLAGVGEESGGGGLLLPKTRKPQLRLRSIEQIQRQYIQDDLRRLSTYQWVQGKIHLLLRHQQRC